jgi:hypothetical protein
MELLWFKGSISDIPDRSDHQRFSEGFPFADQADKKTSSAFLSSNALSLEQSYPKGTWNIPETFVLINFDYAYLLMLAYNIPLLAKPN